MKTLASLAVLVALGSSTAFGISITSGNPGNAGTDNVLFNDGSLQHSGALVQGNFSGSGSGFIIDFTSASGNNLIQGSGGQATVSGLQGNNPFTSLTFGLEGGATFTKAILNPDASSNGHIDFTVNYIDAAGSPYTTQMTLSGNGQNFFGIEAQGAEKITSITFSSSDTTFVNASQFRLGGFARSTPTPTPDAGSTAALAGFGLLALGSLRSKFRK